MGIPPTVSGNEELLPSPSSQCALHQFVIYKALHHHKALYSQLRNALFTSSFAVHKDSGTTVGSD